MKVLLIANYVPDGQTSMLAFRRVLERELPRLGCELRVVAPPRRVNRDSFSHRWAKWFGYFDKFVFFIPSLARHVRWADVVHVADHSNAMYVPWVSGKPNVITCHDVIAIQAGLGMIEGWHVSRTGKIFQRLIVKGLARADLIACVSDLTKRELQALHIADEGRITTVTNGLNDDFSPVAADEAQRLISRFRLSAQDDYLIHVGGDLPRKNRRTVLAAFIELEARAVASGRPAPVRKLVFVGPEMAADMVELAQKHQVTDRIKTVQDVSHEELRALYAGAKALLFPSLQEGFGWPVIEAQACGCPVFTSNFAPMNEIGGPGAVYVDPHDAVAIASSIEEAAPRFEEMRRLGLANAMHYTTAQMASGYVATYRRVVEARGAHR